MNNCLFFISVSSEDLTLIKYWAHDEKILFGKNIRGIKAVDLSQQQVISCYKNTVLK